MKTVRLSDVSLLITKGTTPSSIGHSFSADGVNFVKAESITSTKFLDSNKFDHISTSTNEKMARSKLQENDLVVTIAGHLGRFGVVKESHLPANTNQAVGIIRPNHTLVDVDYLYYYFTQSHMQTYIKQQSAQSVQANLNLDLLGNLEFIGWDLADQRKIAMILSSFDNLIQVNLDLIDQLEDYLESLFMRWFLEFEYPVDDVNSFRESGGEFSSDNILDREIPKGWTVASIGELCEIYQPETISGANLIENGKYKVFGSNGVIGYYDRFNHPDPEVVVSCRGDCGNVFWTTENSWITGNAMVFKPRETWISKEYILRNLRIMNLKNIVTGTVQGQITRNNVSGLNILRPTKDLMKLYSSMTDPAIELIREAQDENEKLNRIRLEITPLLISGEIQI